MNISSLYQYGSLYMPAYNALTSSATQGSSQADTGSEDFSKIYGATLSNSDGDTVQLSSSGTAGMSPMMGNDTTASDIKSFLDKVANGTATATDLQNMETEMEQAASSTGSSTTASTGSSTGVSGIGTDIKSFLNKVANGTATATDLQNMETEMEQAASTNVGSSQKANNADTNSANDDLATVSQSSMSQQMLNSAIYAYSNNNAGYVWNSTQSMTA
jgi:hypothetical protein